MGDNSAYIDEFGEFTASAMKFGVVVVREFGDFAELHLMPLLERFAELGCTPQNIVVRSVPSIFDVVVATQFLAQYTDVDGVVIVMPENRIISALPIMNGIVQSQLQWNMVITVGGSERADHVVEMVAMQSEMAAEAQQKQESIS